MRKPYLLISASVALFGVLAGCSGNILPESKKIEYKSAGKLPPLEIPPDLTQQSRDEFLMRLRNLPPLQCTSPRHTHDQPRSVQH